MLRLSKLTDYAVVVLAELARHDADLLPASRLTEITGLPEPTVAKVMKTLSKSAFVESVKGAAGGYKLKTSADQISLSAIIEAMEGPVALVACIGESPEPCQIEDQCCVRGRWRVVNDAVKTTLDNITLSDMVPALNERSNGTVVSGQAVVLQGERG